MLSYKHSGKVGRSPNIPLVFIREHTDTEKLVLLLKYKAKPITGLSKTRARWTANESGAFMQGQRTWFLILPVIWKHKFDICTDFITWQQQLLVMFAWNTYFAVAKTPIERVTRVQNCTSIVKFWSKWKRFENLKTHQNDSARQYEHRYILSRFRQGKGRIRSSTLKVNSSPFCACP